jgi:hypothetical protein
MQFYRLSVQRLEIAGGHIAIVANNLQFEA